MSITFERERIVATHVTADGDLQEIEVELRRDPLTGRSGRVAHQAGLSVEPADFSELAEMSRDMCPFCPEKVTEVTVTFPPELVPEGRMTRTEATLFPNLSPYDRHSAVAVLTEDHYLPMSGLEPDRLREGLELCRDFVVRVQDDSGEEVPYGLVGMNFLPPAGASLVHPHYHVFVTDRPGNREEREEAASRRYREENGSAYLPDLVAAEEKQGERFIARGDSTAWVTGFVSDSFFGDVVGVAPEATSLMTAPSETLRELAEGIAQVLDHLESKGIQGFNLAVTGDARGREDRRLRVRISPRSALAPYAPVNDVGVLPHQFDEAVMMEYPETLAAELAERVRL